MRSFVTGGKNNGGGGGGDGITSSDGGPGTTSTCSTRALSVGQGDHQGSRGGGSASEVGLSAQQRQQHQPPRQHNPSSAHVSNPYAAGRRPRPPTGAGIGIGTGTGNVSNPYASSGGNAGTCSISNRTNGIGSGIGGAGSVVGGPPSVGPTTGNANANAAIDSVSSASARSVAPANPPSQPRRPPGSGECASGGANGNRVSIMNPPPPRQPMQQPAMTNNPYRQQQSVISRGPSNPYAQSNKQNSNNSSSSSSRPPQQRSQQPMQSAGVGAALLANRARAGGAGANRSAGTGPAMMAPNNQQQQQQQQQQNPWTVARSNVVTKQNLRYKPGPVPIDEEAVKTWIYPNNRNHPMRDYQLLATETAINHNTLVSLPTGLGKTLIAAATMYNYYRWFPTGKVVFCAPTKPLVSQQLTSCFDIMGVPAEHTAEIMGDTVNKDDRARYWEERRLFFCTPQTIDNDIDSGRCDVSSIVCVVIDEAHRAKGKYAYVKIIQKINQSGANFRVVSNLYEHLAQ